MQAGEAPPERGGRASTVYCMKQHAKTQWRELASSKLQDMACQCACCVADVAAASCATRPLCDPLASIAIRVGSTSERQAPPHSTAARRTPPSLVDVHIYTHDEQPHNTSFAALKCTCKKTSQLGFPDHHRPRVWASAVVAVGSHSFIFRSTKPCSPSFPPRDGIVDHGPRPIPL